MGESVGAGERADMAALHESRGRVRTFPWRLFWAVEALALLGTAAAQPTTMANLRRVQGIDLAPMQTVIATLSTTLLFVVPVGLGLPIARSLELGAPILERWLHGRPIGRPALVRLVWTTLLGTAAVPVVGIVDALLFAPWLPGRFGRGLPAEGLPAWYQVLDSINAGITEELPSRLFVLSLVAWLLARGWRHPGASPGPGIFWTSNMTAAAFFALGHLPYLVDHHVYGSFTPLLVVRVLTIYGGAGLVFGYAHWRSGLQAAILGHVLGDIVAFGVVTPLLAP